MRPMNPSERQIMEACLVSSRSTPELMSVLGYAVRTGTANNQISRLELFSLFYLPYSLFANSVSLCQ